MSELLVNRPYFAPYRYVSFQTLDTNKAPDMALVFCSYDDESCTIRDIINQLDMCVKSAIARERFLLGKKSEVEWICWDDEPGALIMSIEMVEDNIVVTVYHASKSAYDLVRSSKVLSDSCGEKGWSLIMQTRKFVDELTTEFSLYRDGTGNLIYKQHWMEFPHKEFMDLLAYAVELSKEKGKRDKMFCISY